MILVSVCICALLLTLPATAQGTGDFTLLVIGNGSRSQSSQALVNRAKRLRQKLGLDQAAMPIKFLTPASATDFDKTLDRLGIVHRELPVCGVVLWNSSENLGPRRFVGDAFARNAGTQDVPRVVQSYLRLADYPNAVLPPFFMADDLPVAKETGLVLKGLRFEASGHPLFVTNFAARVSNDSLSTIKGAEIRFYLRVGDNSPWRLVDTKTAAKIASHETLSIDFIGDSRSLKLLDAANNAVRCQYKVELALDGTAKISDQGVFIPSEKPVGD